MQTNERRPRVIHRGGASEAVYGLGVIGAWAYFFSHAATFWIGVLGFFKGIFWPALLVFEALKVLKL
ncbi:MAG: hypothetical protein K8S20_04635 [Chloroflexi bacterium]|nr:hypothetical protein [Chloroflexota bacterium]